MAVNLSAKALVFLALAVSLCAGSTCMKYKCKPDDQKWTDGTCIYYDSSASITYVRDNCSSGKYCPAVNFANSTCTALPAEATIGIYPGDKCGANRSCLTNTTCTSGVCNGRLEGQACSSLSSEACDPGLYCGSNVCKKILKEHDVCTKDKQCGPNSGCYFNTTTAGYCKELYSRGSGHEVLAGNYDAAKNTSLFCKYIYAFPDEDGVYRCAKALESKNSLPESCTLGDSKACPSEKDSVTKTEQYFAECSCAYDDEETGLCGMYPGDKIYERYLKQYRDWLDSDIFEKHCSQIEADNSDDLICMTAMRDYWDEDDADYLYFYYMMTQYYPAMMNTKECVREVFMADLMDAKEDVDSAFALALPLLAVFGLIA